MRRSPDGRTLASPDGAAQIADVTPVSAAPRAPRAPYALEPTPFPFPHLAAMAGRAGMGGPREIALASLVVARLVADACSYPVPLTADQRRARAQGARHWLGSAAVPTAARGAFLRLADATGGDDTGAVADALESVIAITANQLDQGSRLELARLAQAIAA